MVATLDVQRGTGTATTPTWTTITVCRLRTDDANTQDNTNTIPIDTVLRRSFWASIRLNITGTFTEVSNIRHHCDVGGIGWTMGTTGQLQRGNRDTGDMGVPNASYEQATGTVGTTGNDIATNHTFYSAQTVKVADIDGDNGAGNAKVIDSTTYTAVSPTKHVVLQVLVDTDATSGEQTDETLTWLVDEI
jgi:hypothetical protein